MVTARSMRWYAAKVLVLLSVLLGFHAGTQPPDGQPADLQGEMERIQGALEPVAGEDPENWFSSPDALERAVLCHWLIRHPDRAEPGWLTSLVEDEDDRVVALALRAAAVAEGAEAMEILETALSSPDGVRRELAALSLQIRSAVATRFDLPAVPEGLQQQSRIHIVSSHGQEWLVAIGHYQALEALRARWFDQIEQLGRLESQAVARACVLRIRQNPGLLLSPNDTSTGTYRTETVRFPDLALLEPVGLRPVDLLLEGRHDQLADLRFAEEDRMIRLDDFLADLAVACQASAGNGPVPASLQAPVLEGPGDRVGGKVTFDGWTGVHLSITNHPFAYRPGRGDFLLGEDIEYTVGPHLLLALRNASEMPAGGLAWPARRDFRNGYGFELELSGLLSSQFFDDRSRPALALQFVRDTLSMSGDDPGRGLRFEVEARLSPGDDLSRDVSREPLPQASALVDLGYRRIDEGSVHELEDLRVSGQVSLVQHLFDDPTVEPRQRRWLEPSLAGQWLAFGFTEEARGGVRTEVTVRTNADLTEVSALASNWEAMFRWSRRELAATLRAGVGLGWNSREGGGFLTTPVLGVTFQYTRPFGRVVRLSHALGYLRQTRTLGRIDRLGVVERADATLAFAFAQAMRDNILLSLFFERTTGASNEDRLEWGGVELYLPVAMEILDQELAYRMRYMVLVDSSRFEDQPQEVFEAILQAGMRF